MIIGIDGNEANVNQRVGVNTYAFELLKNLRKLQEVGGNPHDLIVYLRNKPLPDMPEESSAFRYRIISGSFFWILTKLMPNLFFARPRPDIFFSLSHYTPPLAPIPRVCSIMDLGYLEFSGQFRKKDFWQLKIWTAISVFVSKAIIAISNSTKTDIVRHYPNAVGKIYVTPLACDDARFNTSISEKDVRRIRDRYAIVDDYVLYLGTLKPSKNIEGLVSAFSIIAGKLSGVKLVIAGKRGWLYEPIFRTVRSLGLGDRVIFTDFVPEEDKPALIRGAKVFVLPSFWEGFGLDVLNAMACGVPVVVSNTGSLPEVVGSAGTLVEPYNINSIAEGIKGVLLASESKYNNKVKEGLEQVKKFSWEETARQTLEILEKAEK